MASSGALDNIYTQDGTLTGNRIVTQGANTLSFLSTALNGFSVDGSVFSVDALNDKVGIGTTSPTGYLSVNHAANTTSNPIPNPAVKIHSSNSGYNRIQFDNNTSSKFWEIAAATNGTDANAGWSVNYYDGATYKNNIITYGDQKTAIVGDSLPNAWGFNSSDFDVFGSTTLHDSLTINTPYGTAYTLPMGDGPANYVIKTDGNGNLSWDANGGGTSAWNLTGNSGTTATDFIGTTDAQDLVLATNGAEAMRIDKTTQNVGIGIAPSSVNALFIWGSQELRKSTTGKMLTLSNVNGGLQNKNSIAMNNNYGSILKNTAQISSFLSATNEGNLEFSTLNGASPTAKMLISKDGVTIGNSGLTAPTSTLSVEGSRAYSIHNHGTTALTLDDTHYLVISNVVGVVPGQINLPDASTCNGRVYVIKKAGGNNVTIQGSSGQTIDGLPSIILGAVGNTTMTIISDGSKWYIINKF